jgi:hypothetical protein
MSLANTRVTNQISETLNKMPELSQLELSGTSVLLKREELEAGCRHLHTLDLP